MTSRFTVVSSPSNEQLALRAQEGCRQSFAELVERFQVPLVHFLRQRTPSAEDAEDLAQEAFVRVFRNLERYHSEWRFSTWLFTIAHRLSLNARRRQRPTADSRAVVDAPATGAGPDESLAAREDAGRLWQLAGEVLSTNQLTTLWLFYVEEMPLDEIATVVGRSPGAAKGLLFRARQKLKLGLAEQEAIDRPTDRPVQTPTTQAAALVPRWNHA